MELALLANDTQWREWQNAFTNTNEISRELNITRTDNLDAFLQTEADVYLDLLYVNEPERNTAFKTFLSGTVIVNAVTGTLAAMHTDFCRLNGWPGFLQKAGWEMAWNNDEHAPTVAKLASLLGKKVHRVPDISGLVSPRVIAMIVNEAFFALEDNVSTKEEIDTAMKLGTNYPEGPFQWGETIGFDKIYALLEELSREDERYTPSKALKLQTENLPHA